MSDEMKRKQDRKTRQIRARQRKNEQRTLSEIRDYLAPQRELDTLDDEFAELDSLIELSEQQYDNDYQ